MSPRTKACLAAVLALALAAFARAEVKSGDAFPSLAAAGLRGSVPDTAGKIVLVDFWASWCSPCKASFPAYAKLHADYAARGLVIVAVSSDESVPDYERFVRKLAPPFATVLDQGHKLVQQVRIPTTPTSYLVGRDGRVRFVHPGYHDDTDRELRKEIDSLLAEKN
ncbi:MAG TPA: TlpA disulfide reductase family protein [Opitutaceae bacterium]|nr:TlpA disulfide reductase family protein [Opitutaceae bacterium]